MGEGLWTTSFPSSLPILWVTYASQLRWGAATMSLTSWANFYTGVKLLVTGGV